MKKLILLIAIAMMAVSTGLSLEPTRVSVYAPAYQAGTPATNVRVDLVDYNGGANTLFTGHTYTTGDAEVTADDNGVITINVGQNSSVSAAWDLIEADDMNTFWTFDVYINGTLYSQGRVDQQVIIQANTSIFNSSGVLMPSGNPSTVGDDNNRFDAVYVKENEADLDLEGVYIGPSGGVSSNQLALTYDNTGGNEKGIIAADGADIMYLTSTGIDFNDKILDNVTTINDNNQALTISGAITADQAANTIGDNTDGLQLTIDGVPSAQPVNPGEFELEVDGDAKMNYLEVNGFSLTGDFNMNDNSIYNVNEIFGNSTDGTLLLNATPPNVPTTPAWVANGPITTGTGLFTINGNLDATNGVDVTGDDLTVNNGTGNVFSAELGSNGSVVMGYGAGTDIYLGASATDNVHVNGEVQTNIVPGSTSLTLGTDADRWLGAYFLGNSVHIGDANGDNSDELEIGWGSDIATFSVNAAAAPQFAIDATTGIEQILLDPVGNGVNYTITEGYININNSANADLHISETQIMRTDPSDQTLTFRNDNVGAVLNIDIEGKLDVQSAASTMGDDTDNTQLTIDGQVGSNNVLVVEGNTDIDGALNADGNTTLNEDVTLGDDLATDLTTFNSKVNSSIQPNGAATAFTLGTDAERWADLYVLGSSVHVGDANGEGSAELEVGYATNVATMNVDGATNNQLTVDATNDLVTINASDDAIAELTIDPTDAAVGFLVNSNSTTGAEITSNASGILLDPDGDGTNYTFVEGSATFNTGGNTDLVITEGSIERNSGGTETLFIQNTTGTDVLDVDIDGKINVQSAASTIGDAADATQLTIEGLVGSNNVLVVEGNTDIDGTLNADGNTTLNSDVTLGDSDGDNINPIGDYVNNITPDETENTLTLGEDDKRWQAAYIMGNSVHVGPEGGTAGNTELNIGYAANAGTINVSGGSALSNQVTVNAAGTTTFDPAGDGTSQNLSVAEGGITLSNGGTSDVTISDAGVSVNNAGVQTFAFTNSDGTNNLDVTMDGDLDVAEQITGANTGHSLGTSGTNGTVLNILGDPNVAGNELDVEGDVQIDGTTNIDGVLTATAAANTIGSTADATQLTILGTTGGTNNSLVVNGNANFDSDVDVDVDLNVDGATTLNGTVALGDAAADEITVNGEFVSSLIPTAASTTVDLGTSTQTWRDLHLSNNAEIANDANIANNAVVDGELRLNDNDGTTNYTALTAPAALTADLTWTLPNALGGQGQVLTLDDNTGTLTWGDASLQAAYDGGQTINTNLNGTDADIVISGTNELDLRVDLVNNATGNVRVDDNLVVTGGVNASSNRFDINSASGSLRVGTGAGVFTVDGTTGATVVAGNLDANNGLDIINANLTVGGANFSVAPANGNTDVGGDLTVTGNANLNLGAAISGGNLTVTNAATFQVNSANGNTEIGGMLGLNTSTTIGNGANVYVINNATSPFSLTSLGSHPDGSVVYVRFTGTLPDQFTDQGGTNATNITNFQGLVAMSTPTGWYVVSIVNDIYN